MRREALAYLACPDCGAGLTLAAVAAGADAHVMQGELQCGGCAGRFEITKGVPILVRGNVDALKTETAARFAEEWTRWTELREYYEKQFLGWVGPVTREDFAGRVVFEGGSRQGPPHGSGGSLWSQGHRVHGSRRERLVAFETRAIFRMLTWSS